MKKRAKKKAPTRGVLDIKGQGGKKRVKRYQRRDPSSFVRG